MILSIVGIVAGIALASFTADLLQQCDGLTGPETVVDGTPIVCP